MSELFDAVDALIASRSPLPPPAERKRLRQAHGLTLDEVAAALQVRRATVSGWEAGKTEPRPPDAIQRQGQRGGVRCSRAPQPGLWVRSGLGPVQLPRAQERPERQASQGSPCPQGAPERLRGRAGRVA